MQILAVILLFIIIAIVSNTVLSKPIYNSIKKEKLIETVDFINSLDGEYDNNLNDMLEIEEKFSVQITIINRVEIVYISSARFLQGQRKKINILPPLEDIFPLIPSKATTKDTLEQFIPRIVETIEYEQINETTTITNIYAGNTSEYLMLDTLLDNGNRMILISQLQSLHETVRIFNMLLISTAIFTMIIIAFMTYLISKRFVNPITNMNDVTKKIAKLDFDAKCEISTRDELAELGNNINTLSGSLESTINDLKEELKNAKRLGELRKRFVSTVSHELKTPISLMQGYAIGLASDVCEEKERRDYYAQVIAEESERLGLLVNELMDLTKLEAGYMTLHEEEFELAEFIDEVTEKFRAANPEKNIIFNKPENNTWCRADVKLLERVIGNYLSNALRHVDDKNEIVIAINNEEDYYNVAVKNSGSAIPEDKIDEVWNSFYRVDEARNRAHGGHGLGLSIVKNIQTAHMMPYGVSNIEGGVVFSFGVKKALKL